MRWNSVELLYRVQDAEIYQIVKTMLSRETEPWVKKKIVGMLGNRKDKQSLELLDVALDNYDKEVKLAAIDVLGNFDTTEAFTVLNKALKVQNIVIKLIPFDSVKRMSRE